MKGQIVNSFGCAKVEWACMFCMFVAWMLFSLFVVVKYFRYTYPDYADLRFLTGERTVEEVVEYFGRPPEVIYERGQNMPYRGCPPPQRKITHQVYFYMQKTAICLYIYIDKDGHVEYVYSAYT